MTNVAQLKLLGSSSSQQVFALPETGVNGSEMQLGRKYRDLAAACRRLPDAQELAALLDLGLSNAQIGGYLRIEPREIADLRRVHAL